MSRAPRKARSGFPLVPLALAALIIGGWCVWWFVAMGRVERGVDAEAAALVPQLHRKADQFMALLLQNSGGRGRIHATRHCDCNTH